MWKLVTLAVCTAAVGACGSAATFGDAESTPAESIESVIPGVQAPSESGAGKALPRRGLRRAAETSASSSISLADSVIERRGFPLNLSELLRLNDEIYLPHEGFPRGVPASYDWAYRPKIGAWNNPPKGYKALTGWAQAFWSGQVEAERTSLQIRSTVTYVCQETAGGKVWTRAQFGAPEGGDFNSDYQGNVAIPIALIASDQDSVTVRWRSDGVYHFWPSSGRAMLPDARICGVVALVEARALYPVGHDTRKGGVLLGLGADYWQDQKVLWNNHLTNRALAIGRMRIVTAEWRWYGLSTADPASLLVLVSMYAGVPGK